MKFARPRRLGRALAALVIIAAISAAARGLWSNGLFSTVPAGFFGSCKVLEDVPGVQDAEIAGGIAFLSVANSRRPSAADGIYALPLSAGGTLRKLSGTPANFHPRGLGLYRPPGGKGLLLMVVNKRQGGKFSIDSFEVTDPAGAPALVAQGTIGGGLLIDPQDVAAADPGTFYVANGAAPTNPVSRLLQSYGILPGDNLLYFNGTFFREAAATLYGARSLVLTQGGTHLVVSGLLGRSLTAFSRQPFTGELTEAGALTLAAGPDKLSLDARGELWAAGHANLLDWRAFHADPAKRAPSQVFRVGLSGGVPEQAEQAYGNAGGEIAGASVALSAGKRLLIGSSLDGKLLDCMRQ